MGRVRVRIGLGVGFGLGLGLAGAMTSVVVCRRTLARFFAAYVRLSQTDNITNHSLQGGARP